VEHDVCARFGGLPGRFGACEPAADDVDGGCHCPRLEQTTGKKKDSRGAAEFFSIFQLSKQRHGRLYAGHPGSPSLIAILGGRDKPGHDGLVEWKNCLRTLRVSAAPREPLLFCFD
jgi:hypothetical protein